MFIHDRGQKRPFHLGPFPFEVLPRSTAILESESRRESLVELRRPPRSGGELGPIARRYLDLFLRFRNGPVAPERAPVPEDRSRRSADIKGGIYFLDASHAGICRVPDNGWLAGHRVSGHGHGVAILVEEPRQPEPTNLAREWVTGAAHDIATLRAGEIAVCIAGYIRQLGFAATAHVDSVSDADIERLAVLAGIAWRVAGDGAGGLESPFVGGRFAIAAVTTEYELEPDLPLKPGARPAAVRYWLGINGAESGRERARRKRRPSHYSRYPMETVKRVSRPTTVILDQEVPRVPRRAAFFQRALHGDLGPKARFERGRFAYKHPFAAGMMDPIRTMAPRQDGTTAKRDTSDYGDPAANARALKSLSYSLGADLTAICEIPPYAWFSHREDGSPIEPYHRYAVVMLIDQGFDTMEGSSGDDWISGAQSMRAYMRGAEIAGVMAELLRDLGLPARPQTNTDSDVLHIPLLLLAGLGELSRIGELVLNPFVGPRFKSVVLTTDMPLETDQPVDFGLQDFCSRCRKCARECPCGAISLGDKVMFNAYEIWKPDVERCARYRITNPRGSACGRCMKTCPLNKIISRDGAWLHRIANWLGVNAGWLKPLLVPLATRLDDRLGYGRRNPPKKWWLDLEIVDDVCFGPKGTNRREIDPQKNPDPGRQKIAYYPAASMPPPDADEAVPVDRKAALSMAKQLETPVEAEGRMRAGTPPPAHYRAAPPRRKDNS